MIRTEQTPKIRRRGPRRPGPGGPQRPRIAHWFLDKAACAFRGRMYARNTPFLELRRLIEEQVPSAEGAARQREIRDELIESIVCIVYCLLARMDLRSLRIGFLVGGKHDFVGLPRHLMARWAGRSEETATRVLRLLRHAGLVHGPGRDAVNVIRQPVDREGGISDWHPAVRQFQMTFFEGLGLWADLKRARAKAKPPSSGGGPIVGPLNIRALINRLANEHALERPPDS